MTSTPTAPAKSELLHSVRKDGMLFEVYKGHDDEIGYGYVGYCDGVRSVVATSVDVALRALNAKHALGLPLAREVQATAEVVGYDVFTARRLARLEADAASLGY